MKDGKLKGVKIRVIQHTTPGEQTNENSNETEKIRNCLGSEDGLG